MKTRYGVWVRHRNGDISLRDIKTRKIVGKISYLQHGGGYWVADVIETRYSSKCSAMVGLLGELEYEIGIEAAK